ncbi:MAG TPA: hypothetical protein VKK79_06670 [Candidatus Lokiarchaeia archaeon]|nr:hypothetical protein [Candidatus Lokiarchaeia archaeon]
MPESEGTSRKRFPLAVNVDELYYENVVERQSLQLHFAHENPTSTTLIPRKMAFWGRMPRFWV